MSGNVMTRRGFLSGLLAAGAAYAASRVVPGAAPPPPPKPPRHGTYDGAALFGVDAAPPDPDTWSNTVSTTLTPETFRRAREAMRQFASEPAHIQPHVTYVPAAMYDDWAEMLTASGDDFWAET